jgi:hypothetical protein
MLCKEIFSGEQMELESNFSKYCLFFHHLFTTQIKRPEIVQSDGLKAHR